MTTLTDTLKANGAIYTCGYCGAQFDDMTACREHKKKCKEEYEEQHARCRKCGAWVEKADLGAHYMGCTGTGDW